MYNKSYIKTKINNFIYSKKAENLNKCIWCGCYFDPNKKKNSYFCSKRCKKFFEKEKGFYFKHNNQCKKHAFSKLTYRGKCWECYKQHFFTKETSKIWHPTILFFNHFFIFPTFRTSTKTWNGDKNAFEQALVEQNIKWFIYIKFYVNKSGKIKPLVCGVSGSLKVNASGSDLNFSTEIKDGPSRQFLCINKLKWFYPYIAIRKCKNKSEAYKLERFYQEKFDLYGS